MVYSPYSCQVCLTTFQKMYELKKHFFSKAHRQKMVEVFKCDVFNGHGFFPYIIIMDSQLKHDHSQPIIGLSVLTLCFSRESQSYFYLCHVCEEKRPPDRILCHMSSGDHCSNYFNFTDPNILSFSWIPSMDMRVILRPQLTKEVQENGPGTLQMLDLPAKLMKTFETSSYSEVMLTLRENDELNKLLEAVKPKRTMIQSYQRDSNRKHPLLGMQHLVECICKGPTEKRYYLCTLCKLTLAPHVIIKHVLSFDHIFSYFKERHPSTLLSKDCYRDYKSFISRILDFSKQTEEIYGTSNTEMKQVILDSSEYMSVNFACYAEALKRLESKTYESNGSSLITSVKPGEKLEYRAEQTEVSSQSYSVVLRCQHCGRIFETISKYFGHLSKWKHKKIFMKCFGQAIEGYEQTGWKPFVGLYKYLQDSLKENRPVFGVSLIVTCISTQAQAETVYVCFGCEDSFSGSFLIPHLKSKKHLINTLLYQNPWRLPFAWEHHLDVKALQSEAWEEEKDRGPNRVMMMKVFDMPPTLLWTLLPHNYHKVMKALQLHHSVLKDAVPRRETYSKLKQNERFPLLGKKFMVMYDVRSNEHNKVAFLCLLCEKTLLYSESDAHVFSRDHVEKFLDRFHPGSLTSGTDAQTVLDLAKQAARIHPISHVQVIKLERPIPEHYSYYKAISILSSLKRRKMLEPPVTPKMKLVPRETVKEMDHVRNNGEKNGTGQPETGSMTLMKESENKCNQKSTDISDTVLKMTAEEVDPENAYKHCGKSKERGDGEANKESPAPSGNKSDKTKEAFSETTLEETKDVGSDTCQLMKEEKMEEPATKETSGETPENCQHTEDDGADTGKEQIKSSPDEDLARELEHKKLQLTSTEDTSCEEHQNRTSSGLKQETTVDKEGGKPCQEVANDMNEAPSHMEQQSVDQLWQYIRKKSREPVVGLSALYECLCDQHDTVYLCECCSVMILEKSIIDHVTGFHHRKMYLEGLQTLPPQPQREEIKRLAEAFESLNGYGEAQVVDLDEEIYNIILKQDVKSALQTVRSLETLQESRCEHPSASCLSGVQRVDSSVILQAQHEAQYMNDNIQVVEMEMDNDSEDPETKSSSGAAAMSVMTEPTSNTTKVLPESTVDVTVTYDAVPQSADNANVCLTVSRSAENTSLTLCPRSEAASLEGCICTQIASLHHAKAVPFRRLPQIKPRNVALFPWTKASSRVFVHQHLRRCRRAAKLRHSLHVPKSRTDSTTLNPDSAQQKSKDGIVSNTSVESLKMATTSNILETSQTSTTSRATVATTSLSVAKLDSSTTTTCGSPTSSATVIIQTKLRETDYKNAAAICSATASTTKLTAAKLNSSITTKSADVTSAKIAKPSVNCENTQASAKNPNADVTLHIHMSNPPAVPDGCRNKNPPREPSHVSMTKTKSNESYLKIGINHLITVTCKEKMQVYCQLCSVRLDRSSHTQSEMHKYNYVKLKDPGWTAHPSEHKIKLDKTVAFLVEKDAAPQKAENIEVMPDEYKELAYLPQHKAIEKVKIMMRDRALWKVSSPKTDAEALRQTSIVTSTSPYEVSSPNDDVINVPGISGFSTPHQPDHENKQELQGWTNKGQDANDRNQGQHHLRSVLTKNYPEPVPGPSIQQTDTAGRGHQSASRISAGVSAFGGSNLSTFLKVKKLDTKQIIGLGSVWECQGISVNSLYLCESCRQMVSVKNICHHMVSYSHQFNYMRTHYARFLYFMEEDDVPQEEKENIFKNIVPMISAQESFKETDAQVVLLTHELYESVRAAPFSEALKIVQNLKKGQKPRVSCQPINIPQQKDKRLENHQSQEESLQLKMQPALDNKARQKTEKHHLEATAMVRDSTETHRSLKPRSSVSQHQRSVPELQVKQAEVHSESPSFSTVNPKTKQALPVSPTDKCIQSRKRPAPTSFETHYTKTPKLKDPRKAKYSCSSLQPVSQCSTKSALESTSVNPVATSTLLCPKDKGTGPGYDEQKAETEYAPLIALVKDMKSWKNACPEKSATDDPAASFSNSSEGNVKKRLKVDSKCV